MSFAQCIFLWQHVLLRTADDVHECGQAAGCGISHRLSDLEECKETTCVCVVVWLLTLAGMVPLLTMKQTTKFQGGISCFDILADPSGRLYVFVFIVFLFIYFVLPLVVILVSYSIIIYVLCAKRDHSSSSGNRRRAAIMAIAVLTEFLVCFAPSNGLLLNHFVCVIKGSNGCDTSRHYQLAVCLGSSSVFLDPLLYYYGSSHYRQQIRSMFFWVSKAKRAIVP